MLWKYTTPEVDAVSFYIDVETQPDIRQVIDGSQDLCDYVTYPPNKAQRIIAGAPLFVRNSQLQQNLCYSNNVCQDLQETSGCEETPLCTL